MTALTDLPGLNTKSIVWSLFDSLPEGVIIWNAEKVLEYANSSARRITSLALDPGTALLAPTDTTRVHVVSHDRVAVELSRLPVYRAFAGENVPREEMHYVDPNGNHRWLSVSASRVLHDDGSLAFVISSMRDISIRKSRESKLEFMVESAKILQLDLNFKQRLIEKAKLTVPMLADWCLMDVLDDDGHLERAAIVHGDPERIERFRSFERTYPSSDGGPGSILSVVRSQQPLFLKSVTEEDIQRAASSDDHMRDLRALNVKSLMIIPISSHGRGVGAMTLAYSESGRTYDESDLEFFQEFCYHLSVVFDNARLFHEIETRDKSKEIFLAALSHELRNPLAPIKSSLELLKLRDMPHDIREEIDIVEHQFDHMAHLLNDLLDVTRFTQDRISLSARPVELRRLIERSVRASDGVIRKADITLHLAYPSSPISVVADETRLEQAVSNLLSNAVKFTPAGGSIWVDIERHDAQAIIRVRDNGTGIDAADLPHIFDMYYQGSAGTAINSGLGIGLLLVQRIVTMHGGDVTAKSAGRGAGSEFAIRLPLVESPEPEAKGVVPASPARNVRIIVADDNAPAADALVRLLNKLGARAEAVYSGYETLGCEHLHEIDLFLLDVGMPHMDGYELVAALRNRGISAPIVALTGYGLSGDKQRAHEAGFTAHLTKPVSLAELHAVFEQVLVAA